MLYQEEILNIFQGKKIIILGFGREGASTYRFLRKYLPQQPFTVADKNEKLTLPDQRKPKLVKLILGEKYNQNLNDYDLIIKSPGVSIEHLNYYVDSNKISSQAQIFMQFFGAQTIGVTGTKGKSTTSSLIYHILRESQKDVVFAGNIGIPFFDVMDQITTESTIVVELSAHQLQFMTYSPHIAVLLNLFPEHLDYFNSFSSYQNAKINIVNFQNEQDYFIFNNDDEQTLKILKNHDYKRLYLSFSRKHIIKTGLYTIENKIIMNNDGEPIEEYDFSIFENLPGRHNFNNYMAAILACRTINISEEEIKKAVSSFKGLEHRIEFVGTVNGIHFFNDSISTIPEAAIAAMEAVNRVKTLIIGGFERNLNYQKLYNFLKESEVKNIVFTGPVGRRMLSEIDTNYLQTINYIIEDDFAKIVDFAFAHTPKGYTCLLSPAAASYDQFKNFEERGNIYKQLILNHQS